MTRPLMLASLILPFVVLNACGKDKPPVDTSPPAKTASKAPAPVPIAPAAPTGTASNTKAGAPNTKTVASNTKSAPNSKSATPQGASARTTPAPAANSALSNDLAAAKYVRTVQVAAYPTASPANWWVSELQRQNIPAYVMKATVGGKEVYRVRIGAALTGADAHTVADRIHARYHWPTWITMVEDRSDLPENALAATREYVAALK